MKMQSFCGEFSNIISDDQYSLELRQMKQGYFEIILQEKYVIKKESTSSNIKLVKNDLLCLLTIMQKALKNINC